MVVVVVVVMVGSGQPPMGKILDLDAILCSGWSGRRHLFRCRSKVHAPRNTENRWPVRFFFVECIFFFSSLSTRRGGQRRKKKMTVEGPRRYPFLPPPSPLSFVWGHLWGIFLLHFPTKKTTGVTGQTIES